jgi:hypothetical protein
MGTQHAVKKASTVTRAPTVKGDPTVTKLPTVKGAPTVTKSPTGATYGEKNSAGAKGGSADAAAAPAGAADSSAASDTDSASSAFGSGTVAITGAEPQIFPPGRLLLIHKASHMYENQAWMFEAPGCEMYGEIELSGKMAAHHSIVSYIAALDEMKERTVSQQQAGLCPSMSPSRSDSPSPHDSSSVSNANGQGCPDHGASTNERDQMPQEVRVSGGAEVEEEAKEPTSSDGSGGTCQRLSAEVESSAGSIAAASGASATNEGGEESGDYDAGGGWLDNITDEELASAMEYEYETPTGSTTWGPRVYNVIAESPFDDLEDELFGGFGGSNTPAAYLSPRN